MEVSLIDFQQNMRSFCALHNSIYDIIKTRPVLPFTKPENLVTEIILWNTSKPVTVSLKQFRG